MQVKSNAECSRYSAILSTFTKLSIVIKMFVLSIFERPFYIGFTVILYLHIKYMESKPISGVTSTYTADNLSNAKPAVQQRHPGD